MALPHVAIHNIEDDADRRAERLDRRQGRRGGRRLTDHRPDVLHGVPCDACDTGVLALVDATFAGADLRLVYRCAVCRDEHLVVVDPLQAIAPEVYERVLAAHEREQEHDGH